MKKILFSVLLAFGVVFGTTVLPAVYSSDLTAYPLADNYTTYLSQQISSSGLTLNVTDTGDWTFPSGVTTYAVIDPGKSKMEVVEINAKDDSANTFTIANRARDLGNGITGTAYSHSTGSKVLISDSFVFWNALTTAINSKVGEDQNNTFTGTNNFQGEVTFTGTTIAGLTVNSLTTAQRTALTPTNGAFVYDTDLGLFYQYKGGAWASVDTGTTTPNGSTIVAGVFEEATVAEQGTSSATGGTGARLVMANANLVKTSSGAGDENKIAILNASGQFEDGFISNTKNSYDIFADGSDGAVVTAGSATLTADVFATDYTITAGDTISTGGYRIYCTGTFTVEATGVLQNGGIAGGNGGTGGLGLTAGVAGGAGGSAGVAAAASAGITVPAGEDGKAGIIGGAGGTGDTGGSAGGAGTAGDNTTNNLSGAGSAGAAGGHGGDSVGRTGGAGGAAAAAGSSTAILHDLTNSLSAWMMFDTIAGTKYNVQSGSGGSGGAGGGGGQGGTCGGGGGGGAGGTGSGGGGVWLSAKNIVLAGDIESIGGAGGNGGVGGDTQHAQAGVGGGGAAGSGGRGGTIVLIYNTKTGAGNLTVTGGAVGTIGTHGSGTGSETSATDGAAGTAGGAGTTYEIVIN